MERRTATYRKILIAASAAAVALALGPAGAWGAPQRGPAIGTLSILATPVEIAPAGGGARERAPHGADLVEGDRVITGPRALALITFLDGTTVTVQPGSDVAVRHADMSREHFGIRLLLQAGRVWVRVAKLAGRRSTVSLESNEYTATASDGLIGAEAARDGAFVCWTRAGALILAGADGARLATIAPGQKATVRAGAAARVEPFRVQQATLEVRVSGALPLLRTTDRVRSAGFDQSGAEVNQVFGSLTEQVEPTSWRIEVPAGEGGEYALELVAVADGSYAVEITARHGDAVVYRQSLRGEARVNERLLLTLAHRVESGADPRVARPLDGVLLGPEVLGGRYEDS